MKKLLVLALPLLVLSVSANAKVIKTKIICERGYEFLIVYSQSHDSGPSVVQIMKKGQARADPPQPIRCNG